MEQKNQKWNRIMELIFENPNKRFTVREISKRTKIPSSTVQRYLNKLKKENFLTKENKAIISPYFKFKKTSLLIDKLFKSGLIEHLEKSLHPSNIILFGSARKGEYESGSDIDIFSESTKDSAKIDLNEFEKKLNHGIHLFVEKDIHKLPKHLFNSVLNGIKLSGYITIKKNG